MVIENREITPESMPVRLILVAKGLDGQPLDYEVVDIPNVSDLYSPPFLRAELALLKKYADDGTVRIQLFSDAGLGHVMWGYPEEFSPTQRPSDEKMAEIVRSRHEEITERERLLAAL